MVKGSESIGEQLQVALRRKLISQRDGIMSEQLWIGVGMWRVYREDGCASGVAYGRTDFRFLPRSQADTIFKIVINGVYNNLVIV